jgi:AraC-like DNA-binding protein
MAEIPVCKRELLEARDCLAEQFARIRNLESAAQFAFLSPFHFQRSFASMFKESPHEFLTRIRLEKARDLLVETDLSVSEICLLVGYESLGSFSTKFRVFTGRSPRAYRHEARRVFALGRIWTPKYIPHCFIPITLR